MKKQEYLTAMLCLLWTVNSLAVEIHQGSASVNELDKLIDLPLEDLFNIKLETAGKAPETISTIPASVVLIERKDIKTYGYSTLGEILEHVSGLYLIDTFENQGSKNYGVRGFYNSTTNRNMVILVNGVTQVFSRDSTNRLPRVAVPVEAIDRIEIVRGPMSVIYGSGAFFGVINIITNQVKPNEATSLVSMSVGSVDSRKLFARASAADKDWSYTLNAGSYYTRGLNEAYSQMQSTPSPGVAGLSSDGRLEDEETYFDLSVRYKDFSLAINQVRSITEGFFPYPAVKEGTLVITEASNFQAAYQHTFNKQFRAEGKLNYFSMDTYQDFDMVSPDFVGEQEQSAYGYEGELTLFWTINPDLDLTTGLYYRDVAEVVDKFDLPSFNRPSTSRVVRSLLPGEHMVTQAIFTQANYQVLDPLKLVVGLRLEQVEPYGLYTHQASGTPDYRYAAGEYQDDGLEIIPRFAAIYDFRKNQVLKFLYGKAINRPAFSQTVTSLTNAQQGNLMPENIETLELNYIAEFNKNLISNLSLFKNKLDNLITRQAVQSLKGDYQTYSDNGGQLTTQGIEWMIQAKPWKKLHLEAGFTYQQTDNETEANTEVPYSPNWLGQLKLAYRFTPNNSLALTGYYVGSMSTYYDVTLKNPDGSYGRALGDDSPGYFLIGANLHLDKFFGNGGFVNLRVSNLLNETVRYPVGPTNSWADKGTLGLGRTLMLSVGYEF